MEKKKIKVYLAGGWFSKEQRHALDQLEEIFMPIYDCYSPRIENLGVDGRADWEIIYQENVIAITEAEYIVVSTVDKDIGSIFEAGFAAALGKKIIYYNPFIKTLNVMLSHSSFSVATNYNELKEIAEDITKSTHWWEGAIE